MKKTLIRLSRAVFGWPPAPSSEEEKRALVTRLGREWKVGNLIETGTFRGDMVAAQRPHFQRLATIELADGLYEAAAQRFAGDSAVTVLHGDSGAKLGEAIRLMQGPVLFWLDGHYSGGETALGAEDDSPVLRELATVVARGEAGDVVLIDDARLFGWRKGYPSMAAVRNLVATQWPSHELTVASDIIHILPRRA